MVSPVFVWDFLSFHIGLIRIPNEGAHTVRVVCSGLEPSVQRSSTGDLKIEMARWHQLLPWHTETPSTKDRRETVPNETGVYMQQSSSNCPRCRLGQRKPSFLALDSTLIHPRLSKELPLSSRMDSPLDLGLGTRMWDPYV